MFDVQVVVEVQVGCQDDFPSFTSLEPQDAPKKYSSVEPVGNLLIIKFLSVLSKS